MPGFSVCSDQALFLFAVEGTVAEWFTLLWVPLAVAPCTVCASLGIVGRSAEKCTFGVLLAVVPADQLLYEHEAITDIRSFFLLCERRCGDSGRQGRYEKEPANHLFSPMFRPHHWGRWMYTTTFLFLSMVLGRGLEPPPLARPGPKPGASTNFATPALYVGRSRQSLHSSYCREYTILLSVFRSFVRPVSRIALCANRVRLSGYAAPTGATAQWTCFASPPSRNFSLTSRLAVARLGLGTASHPRLLAWVPLRRSNPNEKRTAFFSGRPSFHFGPPSRIRTYDRTLKRRLLYQLSYGRNETYCTQEIFFWNVFVGAGGGTRPSARSSSSLLAPPHHARATHSAEWVHRARFLVHTRHDTAISRRHAPASAVFIDHLCRGWDSNPHGLATRKF